MAPASSASANSFCSSGAAVRAAASAESAEVSRWRTSRR